VSDKKVRKRARAGSQAAAPPPKNDPPKNDPPKIDPPKPDPRPENDAAPERNEVWAEVRGRTYHAVYSVADGWVEVIADDGQYKTGQIGDSSAEQVAERLLSELYRRSSGGFAD
jgi:hypothetical protein